MVKRLRRAAVPTLEHFATLMGAGLRLIPLDRGAKTTHEPGWAEAGESTTDGLIERGARLWRIDAAGLRAMMAEPLDAWCASTAGFNVGCLHEPSGTVCLDLDHPDAIAALQAGVHALGHPPGYLPTSPLAWASPRGRKWLWRVPAGGEGRSVKLNARRRHPNGSVTTETILELRGSGQDMVPPGYRDDRDHVLAWDDPDHVALADCPAPIADLMRALLAGEQRVIHAMQAAAHVPPDLIGIDPTHVDDYPARLAAAMHTRKLVNANVNVAELLAAHGFTRSGKRWGVPGSTNADGITEPAGRRKHWHCWHESSPLAGQFDAWRAYVELEHGGDFNAALTAAKATFRPRLRVVGEPPAPVSAQNVGKEKTPIAHSEKIPQRSKVSSDETPRKALKTARKAPEAPAEGTTKGEPHGGATRGFDSEGPRGPTSATAGGAGRAVAPMPRRDTQGPFSSVQAVETPSEGPASAWGTVSAEELYSREVNDAVPVVTGSFRLATGTYLLAGKPKSGKSWLALGIGLLVSGSIDEYAGLTATRTGRVLYIGVDDSSDTRMARRVRATMREQRPNANLEWVEEWPPAGMECGRLEALERYIEERAPVLVVIDTHVAFRDAERSQSVVQQEYDELKAIQAMAIRHGVMIVLVAHLNKQVNPDPDEPFATISGSNGVQAAVDGMLVLLRVHGEDDPKAHRGGVWVRTRDYDEDSVAMELSNGRWESLKMPAASLFNYGTRRAIEAHLLGLPADAWATSQEVHAAISEHVEVKRDGVRKAMGRMVGEGALVSRKGQQGGGGGFRLTGHRRAELMAGRRF